MPRHVAESKQIPGLRRIEPEVFRDFRGEFVETFTQRDYAFTDAAGDAIAFVEDGVSLSRRHILRGLHGDTRTWKLVNCLEGEVYVVIADMREGSPSHLQWEAFNLSEDNRHQLLVPAGCGTGHLVVSERAQFGYKLSSYYEGAAGQFSVRWDDPKLGISWPVTDPLLSERDANAPLL